VAPPKSWQQTLQELWELLKDYAAQETIGPLKNLKRQASYGLAGSMCVALGAFLLAVSILRLLQTHVQWTEDHNWSQYGIAVLFLVLVCGLAARKMKTPLRSTGTSAASTPSPIVSDPEPPETAAS